MSLTKIPTGPAARTEFHRKSLRFSLSHGLAVKHQRQALGTFAAIASRCGRHAGPPAVKSAGIAGCVSSVVGAHFGFGCGSQAVCDRTKRKRDKKVQLDDRDLSVMLPVRSISTLPEVAAFACVIALLKLAVSDAVIMVLIGSLLCASAQVLWAVNKVRPAPRSRKKTVQFPPRAT